MEKSINRESHRVVKFWDKMTNIQVFNFIRALTLPIRAFFEKLSKKIIFFKSKNLI